MVAKTVELVTQQTIAIPRILVVPTIATRHEQDYISLTDMVRNFDGGSALIEQWLKNKDTVLFLGVWEQLNNSGFNSLEFEGIRNEAGRNSFFLSAKKWIEAILGGTPDAIERDCHHADAFVGGER